MSPFVLDCAILENSNDIVSFKASLLLRSRNRKRVLLMKEGYENSFVSVIGIGVFHLILVFVIFLSS